MEYAFSFQRIVDGNGPAISITGMFIVFFALITISTFVVFLPKILRIFNNFFPEEDEEITVSDSSIEGKEIVAAIGYALLQKKSNT